MEGVLCGPGVYIILTRNTIAGIVCVSRVYIILARCTLHTDRGTLTRGEDILYLPEIYNILTQSAQH